MDHSNDHRRLREALEVSQSDDLAALPEVSRALAEDPQLRLAYERIQRWDLAIGATLDQVELPQGLQQRILARLADNGAGLADNGARVADNGAGLADNGASLSVPSLSGALSAAAGAAPLSETAPVVTLAPKPPSGRGRPLAYWSGIGAAAVTAAALVIATGYWLHYRSDVEIDQLAQQWQGQLLRKDWQPIDSAPTEFPYPQAMRVAATHWQWIGKLTSTPVVAYHLTDGKTTALLYAARMTREGLATAPRREPQRDTGGRAIGWWRAPQKQGLVYVLVVDDDKQYSGFVRPASTPLAILLPLGFDIPPALSTRRTGFGRKIA